MPAQSASRVHMLCLKEQSPPRTSEWVSKANRRLHECPPCLVGLYSQCWQENKSLHPVEGTCSLCIHVQSGQMMISLRWSENITVLAWPCILSEQTTISFMLRVMNVDQQQKTWIILAKQRECHQMVKVWLKNLSISWVGAMFIKSYLSTLLTSRLPQCKVVFSLNQGPQLFYDHPTIPLSYILGYHWTNMEITINGLSFQQQMYFCFWNCSIDV